MNTVLGEYFSERKEYTQTKLDEIRNDLLEKYEGQNFGIVAGGSFARFEASDVSDVDYYIVYDKEPPDQNLIREVQNILARHVENMPSVAGPFATISPIADMVKNIGGNKDENASITKRVLLLLEGGWLLNKTMFDALRAKLIEVYVKSEISERQIALFLLNDIIRYYRTVCVDFNYKTEEDSKPWGLRNIKLVFSRKLLYFCGVLAVAETANMTAKMKREKLLHLFSLNPIDRMMFICGREAEQALELYEFFLRKISDREIREKLKDVKMARDTQNDCFRELKNSGHQFTHELYRLLRVKYDSSHPIHRMIVL